MLKWNPSITYLWFGTNGLSHRCTHYNDESKFNLFGGRTNGHNGRSLFHVPWWLPADAIMRRGNWLISVSLGTLKSTAITNDFEKDMPQFGSGYPDTKCDSQHPCSLQKATCKQLSASWCPLIWRRSVPDLASKQRTRQSPAPVNTSVEKTRERREVRQDTSQWRDSNMTQNVCRDKRMEHFSA